jgi:hypothetical protein
MIPCIRNIAIVKSMVKENKAVLFYSILFYKLYVPVSAASLVRVTQAE